MKIYFARINNENRGPYSLEELKSLNLNREDFIWKEGFADWKQVKELEELDSLFSSPPPFTRTVQNSGNTTFAKEVKEVSTTEKTGSKFGRNLKLFGLLTIIIIIAVLIYNKNETSSNYQLPFAIEKTPEQLKAELVEKEKQNPSQYLDNKATMRTNLIDQKVIEGTVSNTASVAIFKDLVLEVSFLSKTQSIISTQKFTIYEVIAPQQTVNFKFKTYAPTGTEGFSAMIVDATPTN